MLNAFDLYFEDGGEAKDIYSLLDFLFADKQIKTILFIYLYQVNDWFGSASQNPCQRKQEFNGYLSCSNIYRQ